MNQAYVNTELPQTSTPLKLVHDFLQKSNEVSYQVDNELQDNKSTRFLGSKAVNVLNKWFMENRDYPYPDEQTTDCLAREAEISTKQVKKWFANKRVRSQLCCKPIHRNRKPRNSNGQNNNNTSNENIKFVKQEHSESKPTYPEQNYSVLRIPIQNTNQQQQQSHLNLPFHSSSLLQPVIGYNSMKYPPHHLQSNLINNLQFLRPTIQTTQGLPSSPAPIPANINSPFYNQIMLMNLLAAQASQRQAQAQMQNIIENRFSNQSSSTTTTSASMSSAISNSSSNSNEDYMNDLQEHEEDQEEEVDGQQGQEDVNDGDDEQIIDIDQEEHSNAGDDYVERNGLVKRTNQTNEQFISMLMMMNSNFNPNKTQAKFNLRSNDADDHISPITPPPSGTSICTTSSSSVSALPYISSSSSSSSSSSCSSSSSNSKNTSPNSDMNKYYPVGMFKMEKEENECQEVVESQLDLTNEEQQQKQQRKSSFEKKINFAIISTLVD